MKIVKGDRDKVKIIAPKTTLGFTARLYLSFQSVLLAGKKDKNNNNNDK